MRTLLASFLIVCAGPAFTQPDVGGSTDPATSGESLRPLAAAGFVEGRHYRRLSPAQPTNSSPNRVEVAEFFMYDCPACNELEPFVQTWLRDKPDFISFVRLPTAWNDARELHARAFFAAEVLEVGEEIHLPFFREIHINGNPLDSRASLAAFFGRYGVSETEFFEAFDSFAVHTRLSQAAALERRYGIDETPSFVVNGKYRTSVAMAGGSYEDLLRLVSLLAADEREKR